MHFHIHNSHKTTLWATVYVWIRAKDLVYIYWTLVFVHMKMQLLATENKTFVLFRMLVLTGQHGFLISFFLHL